MTLILSILNISGAAADIMYFIYIIKLKKDIKFSELDDGTSFAILSDYDVTKEKHIGLDFVKKMDKRWDESIPRNDCGMFFEGLFTPLLANTFNERLFYRGVYYV